VNTLIQNDATAEWKIQDLNSLNRADINIWVDTQERSVESAEARATFTGVAACVVTLKNSDGATLRIDQDNSQHKYTVYLKTSSKK
jgi:uncharacterized protein YcbX